jgi:hypothetical protein
LFEHDLFGKPVPTFPDHALTKSERNQARAKQDKTGNGYGQKTVAGEFVTHD